MTESYSNHLRVLLVSLGIALGALLVFNLLVDPYASFGLLSKTQFSHSATGLGSRIGKGEMIVNRDWDVLLLGTSRVQMGMDPRHPAFKDMRVYNAGLYGADFPEIDHAAHVAIERGKLKRLILCLDLYCFDPDLPPVPDVQQSLLNPRINRIDYRLSNLLSLSATEESIDTVRRALHHYDGIHYPLGMLNTESAVSRHGRSEWVLGGFFHLTIPPSAERSDRWSLSPGRFEALSALLDDATRAGVKVDLVQLPMHAICLERYFAADQWPLYEGWLTELTHIVGRHNRAFPGSPVTFWNFPSYHSYNTDPTFNTSALFFDPFHFKIALGNLVIDRIMQYPPPAGVNLDDFGMIPTEENLAAHLDQLRQDHAAYYNGNPQVREIVQAIRDNRAARISGE